ncbi:hypothetical protein GZ78_15520 [Endozoicomonas numazuensis]|uniref:Right handed beta helix domain-containing protein n=2 Tax=Endozoicomonas numazuensis TaxID=1137799 RepID=A0A081NFL5_9GAMM|nr:hypothetical protein GZ78_15520 [Endozoicomonas numazuensis]
MAIPDQTENRNTCLKYTEDQIHHLQPDQRLDDAVDELPANHLLIIPARPRTTPYEISKALKPKGASGLMSDGAGDEGLFFIAPASDFDIGDDSIYCLLDFSQNNNITGLAIDSGQFNLTESSSFNTTTAPKVLAYSRGSSQFDISRLGMIGRPGLKALVWVDNTGAENIASEGKYRISRSWFELEGNEYGVLLEGGPDENAHKEVDIKHNVTRVTEEAAGMSCQRGMHLKHVYGQIEHNDFYMDGNNANKGHTRALLALENLHNASRTERSKVAENYFHSLSTTRWPSVCAMQFLQTSDHDLEVHVFANSITDNLTRACGNSPSVGKQVETEENYGPVPLEEVITWAEFFDPGSSPTSLTAWPRMGTCITPLFPTLNLNETIENEGASFWSKGCGLSSKTKRADFNLTLKYDGPKCPDCNKRSDTWKAAAIASFVVNGLQALGYVAIGIVAISCKAGAYTKIE